MEYKRIFRDQSLRFWILSKLWWVPDAVMLRLQYWIKMGRRLRLSSPVRFTEKIQLYKLRYRRDILHRIVDKFAVREYVEQAGLSHTLCRLYGLYDDPHNIDLEQLPRSFVVKTTDGSGGENILICRDKSTIDWGEALTKMVGWRNKKSINAGREWAYTGVAKSQYIVEEYLCDSSSGESGLIDYKIFCFGGKPYCIQIDYGRFINHKRMIMDIDFRELGVKCSYEVGSVAEAKGLSLSPAMIDIATTLSQGLPFVRVDLYWVDGRIYFGELTLYPGSGYEPYEPDDFDIELGKQFDISTFVKL